MRYTRKVLFFLILLIIASLTKSEVSKDGKVVLVAPVLAPYRSGRAHTTETAKDFPLLMLLASDDKATDFDGAKTNKNPAVHHPIYVKKLQDQKDLLRRRRRISRIYFVQRY